MVEFGDSLGALLLGDIITSILYGVSTIQTYTYYQRGRTDRVFLRLFVAFLWFLSSVHLALVTYTTYNYAVIDFANPSAVGHAIWSVPSLVLITSLSDFTIRILFCWRIWILNEGKWPLALIVAATTVCIIGVGLVLIIKMFPLASFNLENRHDFSSVLYLGLGSVAFGDCLIAVALTVLLSRRRTGFSRTDSVIRLLMLYSIETGTLTSLCAISCLVTFATMQSGLVYMSIYFVLSELFLNSLLASLNARHSLRKKGALMAFSLSNLGSSTDPTSHETHAGDNMLAHGIHVETTIYKHEDSVVHIGDLDNDDAETKDKTPA